MMEEFRVAEEAREANVKINQLSQEEVSRPSYMTLNFSKDDHN